MDRIINLHKKLIENNGLDFNDDGIIFSDYFNKNDSLKNSSKLTEEISCGFSEWLYKNEHKLTEEGWCKFIDDKPKTSKELLNLYLDEFKPKSRIISEWLEKHGDPKIEKNVLIRSLGVLEEIHYKSIIESEFSNYTGHYEGQVDTAIGAANITKNFSISFNNFVDDMGYTKVDNDIWKSINDEKGKTSEELFEMFIKKNKKC